MLIHIGYSKCASTTIQKIFKEQKTIYYLDKPQLFENNEKKKVWSNAWVNKVKEINNKPVIVSHEHMLLSNIDPILGISIGGQKETKELKNFLDIHFNNYFLLIIIREQSKLILSRYSQYIMQGGKASISKFIELLLPKNDPFKFLDYRYDKILDILSTSKAKKIICHDIIDIKNGNFNKSIKFFLGIDLKKIKNKENFGVSKYGLIIIRLLNILLVKKKQHYEEKTVTRTPYFTWLLLV